jgi:hypothetical protein
MAHEVTTELGTRVLMLQHGGSIMLTRHDDNPLVLTTAAPGGVKVRLVLTPDEALSLIEVLAIAARSGAGRELIDAASDSSKVLGQ